VIEKDILQIGGFFGRHCSVASSRFSRGGTNRRADP
jgi:hypothetical protein